MWYRVVVSVMVEDGTTDDDVRQAAEKALSKAPEFIRTVIQESDEETD